MGDEAEKKAHMKKNEYNHHQTFLDDLFGPLARAYVQGNTKIHPLKLFMYLPSV